MKTNLIFRRQVITDGVTKTVTRIIPVDIPMIDSGDGWVLAGHADTIETCEDVYVHRLAPPAEIPVVCGEQLSIQDNCCVTPQVERDIDSSNKPNITNVTKFESDVPGTAKLVRSRGTIKIVARRGKSTYNQTTPNSVCINDFTKNEFFKNCRELYGCSGVYEIAPGRHYDYWNDLIDKEYQRQKKIYEAKARIH